MLNQGLVDLKKITIPCRLEPAFLRNADRTQVIATDIPSDQVHAQAGRVIGECKVNHTLRGFRPVPHTRESGIDPPVGFAGPLEPALDFDQIKHPEKTPGVLAVLNERRASPSNSFDVLHTRFGHGAMEEVRIALTLVIHGDPAPNIGA